MTQHHSPLPQPSANHSGPGCLQPQPWPSPGPSFKGLLRSPLLTHPKPTALFSKKASALPLNLFSWSAASLATIAVLSSYGTPAFAHHFTYEEYLYEVYGGYDYIYQNHPLLNSIIPICTPREIRSGVKHGSADVFLRGGPTYFVYDLGIYSRTGRTEREIGEYGSPGPDIHNRYCHEPQEENEPPTTTGSIPNQTFLASGGVGSSELCNLEDDTKFNTDLSSLFNDPDGDELTYEVTGNPSWIRATISGSTLDLNALQSAVEGDSTTITVTASDGKDDGDASLSFNVNIVAEKTPKPILSKNAISLTLTEVPPTVEVSPELLIPNTDFLLAQDSYSVTLSCQYRFPVTVEISNTPGSLEIGPTTLRFNETNWNVPQTVRVKTVGTTPGSFTLSHAAVTTNSEGKTVRESDNLSITVTLESDTSEVIEDAAKEVAEEVAKNRAKKKAIDKAIDLAKKYAPKIGKTVGKANPYVGGAIGVEQFIKNREGIVEIFTDIGNKVLDITTSSSGSNEQLNNLAENLYIHHEALQNGNISLDQAFSGQRFYVPLSLAQTDSQDQESSPRFNALLSADIGFSRFSDSSDPDLSIDGTTTNYGIGITLMPNPEVPLLTGLQFGYTRSNSDFELTEIEGSYNLRMFSVSPYIAWDATDSLTIWSAIGYGRPNDETIVESVDGVDFDSTEEVSYSSSGDFFSFAGGANYRVWQSDLSALSIGLSGSTTSLLDNDSKEGSLSAQFSHKFPFDAGQLKTSADLALILSDSGPSATELSGNLNWLPDQGRLSGSTNARVLLFGGDRSEWGIGGSVTLLPGERGEGLSLALRPSFGQTNTALSNLHLDPFSFSDPTELAISTAPLTARFNAELAYGFPTGNHALLTPYTKAYLAHSSNTYTTGLRYQLDTGLDLDLSASHRQRSSGNNDNRFFLQLRSDL